MAVKSFGFSKAEDSPGFLLWQTTMTWQRLIKSALDNYDISHVQFVVLALLLWFEETEQDPIQAKIVNLSRLDKMTVSKAVKKLAAAQFVRSNEHPTDTRAKSIRLTVKGRALAKKLIPLVEDIDQDFFSVIKHNEQSNLIKFLKLLAG